MSRSQMSRSQGAQIISIRRKPEDVAGFVKSVQECADRERDALGFMPARAYAEAADQGKLWVAVVNNSSGEEYAGHLFFGGAFPRLRVFQLFVASSYRRRGVGALLLNRLIQEAEALSYLSISARVADDLEANAFWERQGFEIVVARPGGKTKNRLILVREKRLSTPTLFDLLNATQTPTDHDLRLAERLYAKAPIYAFDINVLLDIVQKRPRATDVRKIISASMANSIRLFVAPEFIAELQKAAKDSGPDPVLELAATLPQFPTYQSEEMTRLQIELGSIIFPERARTFRLKARDESDLLHLAAAIYNNAAGFITSEKAILKRQSILRQKYAIDVLGVTEFAEWLIPPAWAGHEHTTRHSGSKVELRATVLNEENRHEVESFLQSLDIDRTEILEALAAGHTASPRRRFLVSSEKGIIAYASWQAPQKVLAEVDAFIFVDEKSSCAESALDYAYLSLINDTCKHGPVLLRLVSHASQLSGAVAGSLGFRRAIKDGSKESGVLQKICLGRIVHKGNWSATRDDLVKKIQVRLPNVPPKYLDASTPVSLTSSQGASLSVPLFELEELVGPALLLLPGRVGAVVPIRAQYAERLLGTSRQGQLLPKYEAALLFRRTYYSHVNTLPILKPGTILCFYESKKDGGSGSVVACARSVENAVGFPEEATESIRRGGVLELSAAELRTKQKRKAITRFDTVMKFSRPISLTRLRRLGCDDGSSFVTSKRISHEQLMNILEEGELYV